MRIDTLHKRLNLQPIETILRGERLRWYGHVYRSPDWINRVTNLDVAGTAPRGRPKKTWQQVIADDHRKWRMVGLDPSEREEWRRELRQRTKNPVEPAEQPVETLT